MNTSEVVKVSELFFDPSNARKHNPKNIEAIKSSLAKFGQQKPIVVAQNNIVIAGNGTLTAAKELGWDEITIVRSELKGSDATAFAIADNRTAELAEWEDHILKETLESLKGDFDLAELGFSDKDLAKLLDEAVDIPEDKEFKSMYEIVVECSDEAQQEDLYHKLLNEGYQCRVLSM